MKDGTERRDVVTSYFMRDGSERRDVVTSYFMRDGTERRDVVTSYFMRDGTERRTTVHVRVRNVPCEVRLDDTRHYQIPSTKQGRCKVCKKNCRKACVKGKVNLHDDCFEIYHEY